MNGPTTLSSLPTRQATQALPRIVWMYWAQGWRSAPDLVHACAASWQRCNPDWDVRLVDARSIESFVSIDIPGATWEVTGPAHRAAHLRLKLLSTYGGVWADATCLATRPLDAWLPAVLTSGFFAFRWLPTDVLDFGPGRPPKRVGRTRRMASWFLAAHPGNPLVDRFSDAFTTYWTRTHFATADPSLMQRVADRLMTIATASHPAFASLWTVRPFARRLRSRPYLAMNAVFTRLVQCDRLSNKIWRRTPVMSAAPAHELYKINLDPDRTRRAVAEGLADRFPIQKLDWRMPFDEELASLFAEAIGTRELSTS